VLKLAVHLVRLDKTRPALILTREIVRPHLTRVTVAFITSKIRGLTIEVLVGPSNGLDQDSVINCDNIVTFRRLPSADRSGFSGASRNPC
jgi:mRNA interferase MazF